MEQNAKLEIGKRAPNFEGLAYHDQLFKTLKLSDYEGKWLVLFFYPLDFTFVCPTEIKAFNAKVDSFKKLNCEIIGCSVDSRFCHRAWSMMPHDKGGIGQLKYPLMEDISKDICKAYGCLIESGDDKGVAYRSTFIINPEGILVSYS